MLSQVAKLALKELGVSQLELGKRIGLTKGRMSTLVDGSQGIGPEPAEKLCDIARVDMKELTKNLQIVRVFPSVRGLSGFTAAYDAVASELQEPIMISAVRAIDAVGVTEIDREMMQDAAEFARRCLRHRKDDAPVVRQEPLSGSGKRLLSAQFAQVATRRTKKGKAEGEA